MQTRHLKVYGAQFAPTAKTKFASLAMKIELKKVYQFQLKNKKLMKVFLETSLGEKTLTLTLGEAINKMQGVNIQDKNQAIKICTM